jgi:hypothetical protein
MIGRKRLFVLHRGGALRQGVGQGWEAREMDIGMDGPVVLVLGRLEIHLPCQGLLLGHQEIHPGQLPGPTAPGDVPLQGARRLQGPTGLAQSPLGQGRCPGRLPHLTRRLPPQVAREGACLVSQGLTQGAAGGTLARHPQGQVDHGLQLVGAIIPREGVAQGLGAHGRIRGHESGGLAIHRRLFAAQGAHPLLLLL